MALPDEGAIFAGAELMLVYLVELDGEESPVDLGVFPPART